MLQRFVATCFPDNGENNREFFGGGRCLADVIPLNVAVAMELGRFGKTGRKKIAGNCFQVIRESICRTRA